MPRKSDPQAIEVEVAALGGLDLVALRQLWTKYYASEAPSRMSRELLVRAVAYRIQEEAFGGLSRSARAKLAAAASQAASNKVPRVRMERTMKAGTRFLREWNGRTHEVTAMEDGGFLYRGAVYRSLSAIAREITGTRLSGPTFFGIGAGNGRRGNVSA